MKKKKKKRERRERSGIHLSSDVGRPMANRQSKRFSTAPIPSPLPPSPSSPLSVSSPSSTPKPPSLEEVFATPNLREAFHRFAESQHAEENFLFWMEVEAYQHIDGSEDRQERAKKIIDVLSPYAYSMISSLLLLFLLVRHCSHFSYFPAFLGDGLLI